MSPPTFRLWQTCRPVFKGISSSAVKNQRLPSFRSLSATANVKGEIPRPHETPGPCYEHTTHSSLPVISEYKWEQLETQAINRLRAQYAVLHWIPARGNRGAPKETRQEEGRRATREKPSREGSNRLLEEAKKANDQKHTTDKIILNFIERHPDRIPSSYVQEHRVPLVVKLEGAKNANRLNPDPEVKITDAVILDFIERHQGLFNPVPREKEVVQTAPIQESGRFIDGGVGGRQGRDSRALGRLLYRRKILDLDIWETFGCIGLALA